MGLCICSLNGTLEQQSCCPVCTAVSKSLHVLHIQHIQVTHVRFVTLRKKISGIWLNNAFPVTGKHNAGTLPWYKQSRFFFCWKKKEEVFLSQRKEKKMFCNHTKKGLWRDDAMIICYEMNPSGRKRIGTGNPE